MGTELPHLIAGTFAGVCSTVLLHPLDLVKVRMQVHEGIPAGVLTSTREILLREGFRGLYAGLVPAVLAASASWGGYFYFYEHIKVTPLIPSTCIF